jgi:hypothetical protein
MKINSIALADILANGVAILLILIVISISSKQQNIEKELEQISLVGSVMSRDIASSIVTNSLPSSTPAVLHDYNHERDKNNVILTLYKNYLTIDEYKKPIIKLNKKELLLLNNKLDKFLLNPIKKRLRADIKHIKMYYLVFSIIKKHKRRVSHWHFIGENKHNNKKITKKLQYKNQEDAFDLDVGDNNNDKNQNTKKTFLTTGVEYFDGSNGSIVKTFDGNPKEQKSTTKKQGMYAGLSKSTLNILADSKNIENENYSNNLNIGFADGSLSEEDIAEKLKTSNVNSDTLSKLVLGFLFSYLSDRQNAYDDNKIVKINKEDFKRKVVDVTSKYESEINNLYENLKNVKNVKIKTTNITSTTNNISAFTNLHLKSVQTQLKVENKIHKTNIFNFNLYESATIYNRAIGQISKDSIILFTHKQKFKSGFGWRR